jgi:hypothetical protein
MPKYSTSNRTDTPTETRQQAPTPVSPEQKAAAKHYRRTGDSGPMWRVKSRETAAEMQRRLNSRTV